MSTKASKYDVMILVVLLIIIAATFTFNVKSNTSYIPFLKGFQIPKSCFILTVTGYPCPTCGMTRSFISIGHGEFAKALRYNFGGIFAYVLCLMEIGYLGLKIASKGTSKWLIPMGKAVKLQFIITSVVVLVSWFYINFIYY
jgi:hypothetical protein